MTNALTTEALIAATCPIIRDRGWAFYFVPATIAHGNELGLDHLQFYALGRGGIWAMWNREWSAAPSATSTRP